MAQATHLGDRLVMMHRGRVIHDFRAAEKQRLRVDDLLARFEEVRRAEQIDETAAEMLRQCTRRPMTPMSVTLVNDRSEVERLGRLVEAFGETEGLGRTRSSA